MMGSGVIHLAWELSAAYAAAIAVTDVTVLPYFGEIINQWTTCA
jgi:hypothetical protein